MPIVRVSSAPSCTVRSSPQGAGIGGGTMSNTLYRVGRLAARHPLRTIGVWLLIAVAILGLKGSFGGSPNDNFRIPGVESQRALDLLKERFPSQAGAEGTIVFHADNGALTSGDARAGIEQTLAATASA